ncbi:copper homeostasis protein [Sphingomonas naasensis]|uniref:PF03932 family protein CutC n=1 Tax=Sphingomonas naasensis TaxID=1344951 RepID=A0A4S1WJC3_9SPHN|nr:copper homeostasis protein CutC [Sphingomonas naasensis]NIJ20897.1 copper homeostasis protein [Sphingomonas naasensis]TGX43288.1 copper homeostasis protein CutC [Sphingomonas naasensis]
MPTLLEICVDDSAGLAAAVAGGADRLELCSALELGGLTPSAALIAEAVRSGCPTHAMIRPRAGGFVLVEGEAEMMIEEIRLTLAQGAAGVVVGALTPDGTLDRDALARFRDAARDGAIVLHRAIDCVPDPVAAVREAAALGYDKILSSGGERSAIEGLATLAAMVEAAGDRIAIIAGSGVTPANVAHIIAGTGVREVHGSASRPGPEPDATTLRLGFATGPRRETDSAIVARMRAAIA